MPNASEWVFGILAMVGGLFGLILASHADDAVMYGVGLGLFAFAVLFDFWLIKRSFDQPG